MVVSACSGAPSSVSRSGCATLTRGVLRLQNLTRGCKVYFPVFVEGAKLSMGDMHFSQGDGEVSFCGAIEMSGFLDLKCAPPLTLPALHGPAFYPNKVLSNLPLP